MQHIANEGDVHTPIQHGLALIVHRGICFYLVINDRRVHGNSEGQMQGENLHDQTTAICPRAADSKPFLERSLTLP